MVVAQVKKDDEKFEWIDIPYNSLIKLYNIKNVYGKDSKFSVIKNTKELSEKTCEVFSEETYKTYIWHYVDRIPCDHIKKMMSVKLSDE